MRTPYHFFYAHAGYSWGNGETRAQGRVRSAQRLVRAEALAARDLMTFDWDYDSEINSSDFSDELPAWPLFVCVMKNAHGEVLQSVGGVDFGRDANSLSGTAFCAQPYKRVVEAELAAEEYTYAPGQEFGEYDQTG